MAILWEGGYRKSHNDEMKHNAEKRIRLSRYSKHPYKWVRKYIRKMIERDLNIKFRKWVGSVISNTAVSKTVKEGAIPSLLATMKYIVYATTEKGQGFTTKIGEYDSVYDIQIRIDMFDKDVVINIEEEKE